MVPTKQILIVDDEPEIRENVGRWLKASGFQTHMAGNGIEALAMVKQNPPQAILLDVRMPGKDGMETLAELRSDKKTSNIPVVMLSASLRDEQKALDAGAAFFVLKPYEGKKLAPVLNIAIDQSQATGSSTDFNTKSPMENTEDE